VKVDGNRRVWNVFCCSRRPSMNSVLEGFMHKSGIIMRFEVIQEEICQTTHVEGDLLSRRSCCERKR